MDPEKDLLLPTGMEFDFIEVEEEDLTGTPEADEPEKDDVEDKVDTSVEEDEDLIEVEDDPTDDVEDDEQEPKDTEEVPEGNVFSAFAYQFKDTLLDTLSEEDLKGIETEEDLYTAVSKQYKSDVEAWKEEYKEGLKQSSKGLVEHLENGGTVEDFVAYEKNKAPEYTEDQIKEDESIQKRIIKDFYKRKGFSDRRIQKLVDNSLDLEEDALEMYDELKEISKYELEQAKRAREQQYKETLKQTRNVIDEQEEFIPGRKATTRFKNSLYKAVETQESYAKLNNLFREDPIKAHTRIALLDKLGLLDGDFTKVMEEVRSINTKDLNTRRKGGKKVDTPSNDFVNYLKKYSKNK